MPRTSASASRARSARRVSGRPGGVYLDLPAKLFAQAIDAAAGKRSLIKVVDPAPRQLPAPDAVERALDVLKGAKRPLIILGKGAAYARADAEIRALIEKTGIPYLPMSMAKGLLPDTHAQSASAARSYVLAEADVVMLIGARLNWLLSHGKGKTWGGANAAERKFIQVDISPTEMDSNVPIAAPVVGDIGSCVAALRRTASATTGPSRRADWTGAIGERKDKNLAKMAETLAKNPSPMNFHSALNVIRDVVKAQPRRDRRQRRRQHARLRALHRRHVRAAQAPRRRHLGNHGHRHGLRRRRRGDDRQAGDRDRGRQRVRLLAAWRSRRSAATTCRSASIVFNNNGVYKGTDINPRGGDVAPTVFVKGARYDKMMEAFGGVGVHATTPDELRKALAEAVASGKPTLINAVIDETAGTESGRITSLNPDHGGEEEVTRRSSTSIPQEPTMSKALDGVRILDFTHVQSGPTCTQLLAWFGADVIKVEKAGEGDATRGQLRDIPDVDSLYFTMLNHNKRSITVNTKDPKGKEVVDRLIKSCDVLVENFAPGALDRMGFTWEHIHALNPRMIVASVKGFGPGPVRGLQGLRERRPVRRRLGLDDRLRRRPAARHRRADRRLAAPACTSRSASSPRSTSATRPAAARRCSPRCRTACSTCAASSCATSSGSSAPA